MRVDSMYGIPAYSGDSSQFNYKTRGVIFDELRAKNNNKSFKKPIKQWKE
jgi:hypothetical protein